MKTCTKCKISKQLTDFGKTGKSTGNGLKSWCADCERKNHAERSAKIKQKLQEAAYDEYEIAKTIKTIDENMAKLCELTNHERIREMISWLDSKNTARKILEK